MRFYFFDLTGSYRISSGNWFGRLFTSDSEIVRGKKTRKQDNQPTAIDDVYKASVFYFLIHSEK